MSIDISRETETRLTDEARRLGVSVDALNQFMDEHAVLTYPAQAHSGLRGTPWALSKPTSDCRPDRAT